MKWNPVNDIIISALFYSRFIKTTVIPMNSPTNDADDEEKDTFYENLSSR